MNDSFSRKIEELLTDARLDLDVSRVDSAVVERLDVFCRLLEKWNRKINLTSQKDCQSILEQHVFDSLHFCRWVEAGQRVIDVGSGGGFPGLPVKILVPAVDLVLAESQRKRCSFLREAVRTLGLSGVEVAEGRIEGLGGDARWAGQFQRVLFRGFSSTENCLSAGGPLLQEGGRLVLMKDPGELLQNSNQISPFELVETKTVFSFRQRESQMQVFQLCSTWNNS